MLFEPIMIGTYLVIIALVLYNQHLKQKKVSLMYASFASIISSIILVLFTYTDTLMDITILFIQFILIGILLYSPCYLQKKGFEKYGVVYIISHVIAIAILSGMRTLLLISHPFYYLYPLVGFSSLYIIKHTENKLNALAYVAVFIMIRFFIPIDIEAPIKLNFIDHQSALSNDASEISLNRSKPVIKAVSYFESNYDGQIKAIYDIMTEQEIIILITTDTNEKLRLIYHDDAIKEE